jgi:hypothetical protein
VRIVRAVREIQPEDVSARGNERIENAVAAARRANRRNDFGVSHVVIVGR